MNLGSDPSNLHPIDPQEFFDEIYETEDGEKVIHAHDRRIALSQENDLIFD
jgi:hypothetical protein